MLDAIDTAALRSCAVKPKRFLPESGCQLQATDQLTDRPASHGVDPISGDFRQRTQDECAFAKTGMRDDQPGFVDHGVSVQDQIEIERSGRADVGTQPSELKFDCKKGVEAGTRRQIGHTDCGGVQKAGLVDKANGFGVVEGGGTHLTNQDGQ